MKKITALLLTMTISGTTIFAMPVFNKENDKETAKKIEVVLEHNKTAADKQQAALNTTLKGTVVQGYFTEGFLRVKEFKTKSFNISFFVDKTQGDNSGNMAFTVTANESVLKNIKASILTDYVEGVNGDPDTEIDLSLEITTTNPVTCKEEVTTVKRFTTVTLGDLNKGNFSETIILKKINK